MVVFFLLSSLHFVHFAWIRSKRGRLFARRICVFIFCCVIFNFYYCIMILHRSIPVAFCPTERQTNEETVRTVPCKTNKVDSNANKQHSASANFWSYYLAQLCCLLLNILHFIVDSGYGSIPHLANSMSLRLVCRTRISLSVMNVSAFGIYLPAISHLNAFRLLYVIGNFVVHKQLSIGYPAHTYGEIASEIVVVVFFSWPIHSFPLAFLSHISIASFVRLSDQIQTANFVQFEFGNSLKINDFRRRMECRSNMYRRNTKSYLIFVPGNFENQSYNVTLRRYFTAKYALLLRDCSFNIVIFNSVSWFSFFPALCLSFGCYFA